MSGGHLEYIDWKIHVRNLPYISDKKLIFMEEGKLLDKKSLRFLKGKNTDWDKLAKDCISFANSHVDWKIITYY